MRESVPRQSAEPSASLRQRVDTVCDAFEAAWQNGQRPRPEEYLEQVAPPERALLLRELIQVEVYHRRRRAEEVTTRDYQTRFPELDPAWLAEVIAVQSGTTPPPEPSTQDRDSGSPASPQEDTVSQPVVAGYEILSELGRGGMGVVYKARHVALDRVVALKMILSGDYAGPEELSRFRREAEAVARLRHPHIVQVYEVGEQAGRPFFSLEYVEGGSLARRLHGTPQPARTSARLVETLARAVHHAHQRGVIHRDLKPANVLLLPRAQPPEETTPGELDCWEPTLTDFGLAKRLDAGGEQTPSGAILGTPSYMAPEQVGGKTHEIGPAADVYALGAILYELLTGRPPFQGESHLEILLQVRADEPVAPSRLRPKLPRDLETICLKCLEKEPAKRYASAEALATDLQHFLRGEPIAARPVSSAERLWRWGRRNPRVAALVGTVFALLTLVASGSTAAAFWIDAERRRADQNAERATTSSRRAYDVVYDFLTTVSEHPGFKEPQVRSLRQQLLQSAVVYFHQFVQEQGDHSAVQVDLGTAYSRLARVTDARETKLAYAERSAAIFARFLEAEPHSPRCLHEAAIGQHELGKIHSSMGRHALAETAWQRARAHFTELMRLEPEVVKYRIELAESYRLLGKVYQDTGKRDQALHALQESLKLLEATSPAQESQQFLRGMLPWYSADTHHRTVLASTCQQLGEQYQLLGRTAQAESYFQRVCQLEAKQVELHPDSEGSQHALASTYNRLGVFYRSVGDATKAREALAESVRLLDGLVRKYPTLTRNHRLLIASHNTLGEIDRAAGNQAEADAAFERALKIAEKLASDHPTFPEFQLQRFHIHQNRGELARDARRFDQAEKEIGQAVAIAKTLADEHPSEPRYRQLLAEGHNSLTLLFLQVGKPAAEIEQVCRQALTLREQLVQAHPDEHAYRDQLAQSHHNLGIHYYGTQQLAKAEASFQAALTLREALARDHSHNLEYAVGLGGSCIGLANVLHVSGKEQPALALYGRGVQVLEAALPPGIPHVQGKRFLLGAYSGRAMLLNELQRHADALADWQRGLQFDDGSQRVMLRLGVARTLLGLNDHARAVGEAQTLEKEWESLNLTERRDVALLWARATAVARAEDRLPPKEREHFAERYARQAVQLFAKCAADPQVKPVSILRYLKESMDVNPLRTHAEFQKLLAALEEKVKAGAK